MKRLILLLAALPLLVLAQAPQGMSYQGVATDANGAELINQNISIRASVLSASATGTVEWEETHSTTTDDFGLFTLTIGQGTSTGGGVLVNFSDMDWGNNAHFLKIEMDATGGTSYTHIGTNQMMSVPYALYAENTSIDMDSILQPVYDSIGSVSQNSTTNNSNSNLITIDDVCIEATTVIEINTSVTHTNAILDIAIDDSSNVYAIYLNSNTSAMIEKFDANGNTVWSRSFPSNTSIEPRSLYFDNGELIIQGDNYNYSGCQNINSSIVDGISVNDYYFVGKVNANNGQFSWIYSFGCLYGCSNVFGYGDFDFDSTKVYIYEEGCSGGNIVSVIDRSNGSLVNTVSVPNSIGGFYGNSAEICVYDSNHVLVAHDDVSIIEKLNLSTGLSTTFNINTFGGNYNPTGLIVDSALNVLAVSNYNSELGFMVGSNSVKINHGANISIRDFFVTNNGFSALIEYEISAMNVFSQAFVHKYNNKSMVLMDFDSDFTLTYVKNISPISDIYDGTSNTTDYAVSYNNKRCLAFAGEGKHCFQNNYYQSSPGYYKTYLLIF